ncbi:SusC/RagA family TonB-linked outer membrane protein [Pedobacter aquatilis]|uniref:SusC/RagA family TonB-linked outer membrane protein n=1 Tax=Pedobacter aquatilis TaxID=351343 RepID=UPI00292DB456|nr:SusC/RagA family TonB-linked outer membrane protein [Pedobacter aquatilis]
MSVYTKPIAVFVGCMALLVFNVGNSQAQQKPDTVNLKQDTLYSDSFRKLKRLIYFNIPGKLSTSSSAAVTGDEFATTPVVSYPLALSGRLPGLVINQTNGQPLNEGLSFKLRGLTPLIFIDGIPRSVTEIGIEEIESVTVLKDAVSLAMLGIRGAGGAISIVTKKGNKGQHISFTGTWGIQKPIQNLISNPLDAFNYATLYNEALVNDGLSVATNGFSQTALNTFQSGSDPLRYPNVNWTDQILKNSSAVARYSLNTSGGNNFVQYFINLEHFSQDGLLNTSDANKYNTNANLRGYFIRSNVDVKLTDNISAGIYIQGRILNTTSPGNAGADNLFSSILATPNSAYPIYNANGTYSGSAQFQNNILAQNISSGYSLTNTRTVLSDFYLKYALDDVAKGLWVKARASFFSNLNENIVRNKSFAVFEPVFSTSGAETTYRQYGTNGAQANSNSISFQNRSDFQELSMGYNHVFEGGHGFDATILANRDNLVNGSNLPYTIQGISGHFAYNYKEKYLAEISASQSGANRYPDHGGFKYGFFPAVGLGWNIAKEDFLKGNNWLDNLKLYGSYGKVGRDNGAYFTYQQVYNASPTSIFGSSAAAGTTIGESYLANPNITWEKSNMLNVGLDASFLQNRLTFNVEYYRNKLTDLSIVRGVSNSILGISYPSENIGRQAYFGWETQLGWAEKKNNWGYFINLNASLQNSKLLYSAEANQKYSWMYRTGHPVGQTYGYIAEGLFRSQQEITGYPTIEGYTPQPGDIKYKDLNGDGVINQYDQTTIGSEKPTLFLGARLGFNIAGFDFSTLLQGAVNQQVYLSGNSFWEFQGGTAQAYKTQLDRWTPSNVSANYPRLTTSSGPRNGAVNNFVSSSFWLRNGDYIRVKNIEFGFRFPSKLTDKIGLKATRVFVNGLNLYTFGSKTFNGADPENYNGSYPIEKVFSLGLNIQL